MKCSSKGCTNPASGRYRVRTKGKFLGLDEDGEPMFTKSFFFTKDYCSGCGFNLHNKRTYNAVMEDGVERESFPLAYSSVKLLKTLTPEQFHAPMKESVEITCYCGHSQGAHNEVRNGCSACTHCNSFYDGACTNEP